ncbi:MAG: M15 family metallopeptidase [Bacteroidia bacterium]|nr:M15 family metallopeptidase [Bacteroidia bacterium]
MNIVTRLTGLCLLLSCWACQPTPATEPPPAVPDTLTLPVPVPPPAPKTPPAAPAALESRLQAQGLVNIKSVDPEIQVQMMYSTTDNFLHADVYEDFDACYLLKGSAEMLAQAQALLRARHPDLRLITFDCVRPRSVQYKMWDIVKNTPQQEYVAPPGGRGSMHNYGAAVDLGLVHVDTGLVDMGTPFDFFGELAHPQLETKFLASGELKPWHVANRQILRTCMRGAGFAGIPHEWWHFVAYDPEYVRVTFKIVD